MSSLLRSVALSVFCFSADAQVLASFSECRTKASRNQNWDVKRPASLIADIGGPCPYSSHGTDHNSVCNQCGDLHHPCDGKFVGCKGCHPPEVLESISCDSMAVWIMKENACKVAQVSAEEWTDQKDLDEATNITENDVVKDASFVNGSETVITTGCSLDVADEKWRKLPKVPALLYYQCKQCDKGSPKLLNDCCQQCVKFSQSKHATYGDLLGFTVCQGCQINTMNIDGTEVDWEWKGQYDNYSEHSQRTALYGWVKEELGDMCVKGERRLSNVTRFRQPRLLEEKKACDLTLDLGGAPSQVPFLGHLVLLALLAVK